jgi:NAD(P)-dependent dehydrogenase (short-subunit alcohol dehydrogenase family)
MVAKAENEFGALNIVVNNAGLFANLELKPFFHIENDEFDKVMTINARSIHQSTKAALPALVRAGGGKIVNIASGTFYYGPPGLSHYTASKAAVIGLTRGHARELGDKNIQINAIAVGLTESSSIRDDEKWDRARAPTVDSRSIKREMVPEDLLGTLIFLCTSDSDFITGQTINVDGGKVNL